MQTIDISGKSCEEIVCETGYDLTSDGQCVLKIVIDASNVPSNLNSINECDGEYVGQDALSNYFASPAITDYFGSTASKQTCDSPDLLLTASGTTPPDGYRFVYIDEVQNDATFKG